MNNADNLSIILFYHEAEVKLRPNFWCKTVPQLQKIPYLGDFLFE